MESQASPGSVLQGHWSLWLTLNPLHAWLQPSPGAWPGVSWRELVSWVPALHRTLSHSFTTQNSDVHPAELCPPNPALPLRAASPSVPQSLVTLCPAVCCFCHTWLDFLAYRLMLVTGSVCLLGRYALSSSSQSMAPRHELAGGIRC